MTKEITYAEARRNLGVWLDAVADSGEPILIRHPEKEPVALIPAKELSSWMETAYLLRSPANARHLREAIASEERGEAQVIDVDELAKQLGLEDE